MIVWGPISWSELEDAEVDPASENQINELLLLLLLLLLFTLLMMLLLILYSLLCCYYQNNNSIIIMILYSCYKCLRYCHYSYSYISNIDF